MDRIDIKKLNEYCNRYDIPKTHFIDILEDLKVIPMVRGKAFEFQTSDRLRTILNKSRWRVSNPLLNAQPGIHDIDVKITNEIKKVDINAECKMASRDSIKLSNGVLSFQVKCMRSRTIGHKGVAERLAREYGIDKKSVLAHADQYRTKDFGIVITSLGNAFWDTDNIGRYKFNLDEEMVRYLMTLFPSKFLGNEKTDVLKRKLKDFLLVAKSSDLIVSKTNRIVCRRRVCTKKENCGFIPNYPIVNLNDVANGKSPWKQIEVIETILRQFL